MEWIRGRRTERFGVSIPAVTIRLEMTKQDMRKGRMTGLPVSRKCYDGWIWGVRLVWWD